MKKKLFNLITYGTIAISLVIGLVTSVPQLQELLPPEINRVMLVIVGSSFMTTGAGAMFVKSVITKSQAEGTNQFLGLAEGYDKVVGAYDKVDVRIGKVEAKLDRVIKLLETNLEAKYNDKLVDAETKRIIGGVLNEEEMEK